jgi:hypothetical protein
MTEQPKIKGNKIFQRAKETQHPNLPIRPWQKEPKVFPHAQSVLNRSTKEKSKHN